MGMVARLVCRYTVSGAVVACFVLSAYYVIVCNPGWAVLSMLLAAEGFAVWRLHRWTRHMLYGEQDACVVSAMNRGIYAVIALCGGFYVYWSNVWHARPWAFNCNDIFFQADAWRVIGDMTNPGFPYHARTGVHPLFVLFSEPFAAIVAPFTHDPFLTSSLITVMIACLCLVVFVATLRKLEVPNLYVCLYTALVGTSSTFMIWGSIPETHIWAGLAVMLALYVCVAHKRISAGSFVPISIMAAGVNPIAFGSMLVIAWRRLTIKRIAFLTALTLCALVGLSVIQKWIFPSCTYWFLFGSAQHEARYLMPHNPLPYFLAYNWIIPSIQTAHASYTKVPLFEVHKQWNFCVTLWLMLWAVAFYKMTKCRHPLLPPILGGMLIQVIFCALYSDCTFLFTANFTGVLGVLLAIAMRPFHEPKRFSTIYAGCLVLLLALQVSSNLRSLNDIATDLMPRTCIQHLRYTPTNTVLMAQFRQGE